MSAIIGTDPYKCYFSQGDTPCAGPEASVQGGITASMAGGSWLAALCSGYITDLFGRKKAIMVGAVIWVLGSIIVSASQNIGMLIAGRIINGFAVGICSAQVPVYVSELAPPSKRGRLVGAQQWAITWGIMIMVSLSDDPPNRLRLTRKIVLHLIWMLFYQRHRGVQSPVGSPSYPRCRLVDRHDVPT
jgi:MFS family permease